MQFLQFVLLALTATASLAAPVQEERGLTIPLSKKRSGFTLPQSQELDFAAVDTHLNQLKSKYAATMNAYKANTGNVHPLQALDFSFDKRATGSVALTDVQENLWHGAITLGSQTPQCDFDTGSADIIINNNAYTPGASATNTGNSFTASYGDGTTASGTVYKDTVKVGGLTAPGTSIGRSNNNFIDTATEGDSGICGMSYPSLSVLGSGSTPFFDALINSKAVTSPVFTFTLATSGSRLYLGGVDPNAGNPTYVPVNTSPGYWTVSSTTLAGVSTSSIVDTGTSLIVAPTNTASSIFRALKVSTFTQNGVLYGYYNCNSPPTVTYKYGSFSKALNPAYLSIGTTNNGQCVLGIVGQNIGINSVIAGDTFLLSVHAVFDRQNNRVGFSSQ